LKSVRLDFGHQLAAFTARLSIQRETFLFDYVHAIFPSGYKMKLITIIDILIEDNLSSRKSKLVRR